MLIVKKFGGSSVADKERIFNVARRCAEEYQMGNDVIVVLSAMGDTTDELLEKAAEINPYPSKRELDMLLTTGEQVSVALMAMALQFLNVPAISLNAFQVKMHSTARNGNARFKNVVDRAISVLEFKIKILKNKLNLDNINDKIKFLNEIAKLLSNIDNTMEREIYIEKISDTYQISKEAIYAEVNKLSYAKNQSEKILDKKKTVVVHRKQELSQVSQTLRKRENMILSILLTGNMDLYQVIKINVNCDEFKDELNKKIAKKLYEEFEKGNSNINAILDKMDDEEQSHITEIMADDYGIDDMEKAIDDIIQSYQRDKLNDRKMQILTLLDEQLEGNEKKNLESELIGIVNQLAKMK